MKDVIKSEFMSHLQTIQTVIETMQEDDRKSFIDGG